MLRLTPNFRRPAMAFLVVIQAMIAGCSNIEIDRDMIRKRLEAAVGEQFEQTDFSKPVAPKRQLTRDPSSNQDRYRFTWLNGCSYVLDVDASSRLITGWHFVSEERLCQEVPHRALGS